MFTMAKIRDTSTYLDQHLTSNDYYAEGEQVAGQWHGGLASRFGTAPGRQIHSGDQAFRLLRENINPVANGKLTQRNMEDSIRFFDFQRSAQKSISLLHALTGDERLAAVHDLAAAEALSEPKSFAACRVRDGVAVSTQETRHTGNVCAAVFRHDASRALNPQLHTHFVIADVTWDEAHRRMVALESCEMVRAIGDAGKAYHNVAENAALQAAVAHRFERVSVLRGHDLLAETLNTVLGALDLGMLKQSTKTGGAGLVVLDTDERLLVPPLWDQGRTCPRTVEHQVC